MRIAVRLMMGIAVLLLSGCLPKIALFSGTSDPLSEYVLEGAGKEKVVVISVRGEISDAPDKGLLRSGPSLVETVVSHLRKAEKDPEVRAVLLKIDSPGGTVTASDLLYHEIAAFKKRTGAVIVVSMMDLAASGGYYIALPADRIIAHPTTITGSVGVVFFQPKIMGLMGKLGVDVHVYKTGDQKDMGSLFRETTDREQAMLQDMIQTLGERFFTLVRTHRNLSPDALRTIASARIFLADEALALGLIDDIGYLDDALRQVKRLARLPEDATVVVYRRTEYPDDTIYNTAAAHENGEPVHLIHLDGVGRNLSRGGFYYLWYPGAPDG